MDVERTMEFILEQQARNAVEHEGFERGLKSLRVLVQVGMKMMVKLQEGQKQLQEGHKQLQKELRDGMREMQDESTATKAEVRALVRAQKKLTDALLRQHTNGRPRKQ